MENTETGEVREVKANEVFRPPWRAKRTPQKASEQRARLVQELTLMAADFGLPAATFQKFGAWLLDCPYCQVASKLTKLYQEGKFSKEEYRDLFDQIATAKQAGDEQALEALKGKLCDS